MFQKEKWPLSDTHFQEESSCMFPSQKGKSNTENYEELDFLGRILTGNMKCEIRLQPIPQHMHFNHEDGTSKFL
jgi:hypothetical protein